MRTVICVNLPQAEIVEDERFKPEKENPRAFLLLVIFRRPNRRSQNFRVYSPNRALARVNTRSNDLTSEHVFVEE